MNNSKYYKEYVKYKNRYLSLKSDTGIEFEHPITEFVKEAKKRSSIIFGENYAAEYSKKGVGDPRLTFFFKIVRGLKKEEISQFIEDIMDLYKANDDVNLLVDLLILAFQTRDIRGGKGERLIFYHMLIQLYDYFPKTVLNLLTLIPLYGYFKDYFVIIELIKKKYGEKYEPMVDKIYSLVYKQLLKDYEELEKPNPKISLLAKYIPKEGKHFDKVYHFVDNFVLKFFMDQDKYSKASEEDKGNMLDDAKQKYRKIVSKLNKALNTVEILMSANKYADIIFSKLGSKSLFKYRKAFLNEIKGSSKKRHEIENRETCRENFLKSIKENKISGKNLEIYEIVNAILYSKELSTGEKKLFQAQWNSFKKDIIDKIKNNKSSTFNFGNLLPIIDVSGSMTGMPMNVAIGLGILLSEINTGPLKDKFITFSANPSFIDLSKENNIVSKIIKTKDSEWGMNTDFEAVYNMILDIVKTKKLKQNEIPDIIVLSDMQFDEARTSKDSWKTHHQNIVDKFAKVGMEISGTPYNPPNIIYWNLRSDTMGFPVQKDTPNVQMLSGFSPNLFKFIFSGQDLSEFPIPTPYSTLRDLLDDDRYDIVKEVAYISDEIKKIENSNVC